MRGTGAANSLCLAQRDARNERLQDFCEWSAGAPPGPLKSPHPTGRLTDSLSSRVPCRRSRATWSLLRAGGVAGSSTGTWKVKGQNVVLPTKLNNLQNELRYFYNCNLEGTELKKKILRRINKILLVSCLILSQQSYSVFTFSLSIRSYPLADFVRPEAVPASLARTTPACNTVPGTLITTYRMNKGIHEQVLYNPTTLPKQSSKKSIS